MRWRASAERHAAEQAPAEACGLLVARSRGVEYLPCQNLAASPCEQFLIDPWALVDAESGGAEVVGVVHSHPGASSEPSELDLEAHAASGLQWWILGVDGWRGIPPAGAQPYEGRSFTHGVNDCYTIVRDWYWREAGIWLPDYARGDDWWERGEDLYRQNFRSVGFVEVPPADLRPGDSVLMRIGSPVPNHAAIVLPGARILHHLAGRLSAVETYGRLYRERTTHVLRFDATSAHDPLDG